MIISDGTAWNVFPIWMLAYHQYFRSSPVSLLQRERMVF